MIGEYFIEKLPEGYGIFHTDNKSGFCYALFTDNSEAENYIIDKINTIQTLTNYERIL